MDLRLNLVAALRRLASLLEGSAMAREAPALSARNVDTALTARERYVVQAAVAEVSRGNREVPMSGGCDVLR